MSATGFSGWRRKVRPRTDDGSWVLGKTPASGSSCRRPEAGPPAYGAPRNGWSVTWDQAELISLRISDDDETVDRIIGFAQ